MKTPVCILSALLLLPSGLSAAGKRPTERQAVISECQRVGMKNLYLGTTR